MARPSSGGGTSGMGELSFPDKDTVYLKPILLAKRQQWRRTHPLWSLSFPVSSTLLWCCGLALLLHPLMVLLLRKYKEDDWHEILLEEQGGETTTKMILRAAVSALDALAVGLLDGSPRIAAASLFLYTSICSGYLASAAWKSGTIKGQPTIKQD
ncbi:expressed unknown protein [Seminavis robusta]|uniref:Uncharacterized protein n=1 Tax=Seminavis robusta TaxID=568900 RepID=A0A9N8DTQ4_9STRA|nr:expressed unknown protein [Seminavis robusta]|eukprot:Sro364_g127110.1 n/a (155) ;mRNA; f:30249-30713